MKKILLIVGMIISIISVYGQQPLTKDYMPNVGDTIFYKTSMQIVTDFAPTGENYLWDFSMHTGITWLADTFVSVISTPLAYNVAFNNPLTPSYQATIASPQADMTIPPSTSITNVYYYFKETNSYYAQVGLAANVSGAPLPVKNDDIDFIYHFPFNMNDRDTCFSSYKISIPTLGSYFHRQTRTNHYDGWGTLYTPIDTFEVFRIKTVINARDSVFITQNYLNIPIAFNSITTEYKWFSPNERNPVFIATTVQNQSQTTRTVKYKDNPKLYLAVAEKALSSVEIFPNPFANIITIYSKSDNPIQGIKLYNLTGSLIPVQMTETNLGWQLHVDQLSSNPYLIEVITKNGTERRVMIK